MPTLTRYFVRSSLLCLGVGFTLGGLILTAKAGLISPDVWGWLPAHITLLLFGWLIQLALGVSYWILPRHFGGDRGRPVMAWGSFLIFQLGLLLVTLSLFGIWIKLMGGLLVPGFLLLALGVAVFAAHAAPRIRPVIVR
jgi:heme/copper-type cytochrome/quinol oxidase subunit 1